MEKVRTPPTPRPVTCGTAILVFALAMSPLTNGAALAADHGDVPILASLGRTDLQITDLYVFVRGENLVLALCTDPAVPAGVASYVHPSDLKIALLIDRHSRVTFDDMADLVRFGGTIVEPHRVAADARLEIGFGSDGSPRLAATGVRASWMREARLFAGLRDDPFIRLPRKGRNVAAVVVELPLDAVRGANDTILVWATTSAPGPEGRLGDHAGRALLSMFIEAANSMSPREQYRRLGMVPDVVIFDLDQAAAFPNGRELTDDVVDLVVDIPGGTLPGEGPDYPTTNDVPFLDDFPYLAPPQ